MIQTSRQTSNIHIKSTPRSTTSSRTTRVIEELQSNLENIYKEIETTKAQLQIAKENKEIKEKENEGFIQSNKQLRSDIQEIMQILETKQQLLDATKKTSTTTENQVKQLKYDALAARKELDDLKRREHTVEKARRTIQLEKEKQRQLQSDFETSCAHMQSEFEKERKEAQLELDAIHQKIQRIKQHDSVTPVFEKQKQERETIVKHLENVRKELELNNQNFIIQVKRELVDLLNQMSLNETLTTEVENCKHDVNAFISKIKSNAAISMND